MADIEQALRRDLADAIKAKMSDLIINGAAPTNQNPQNVQGFLATIAAPDDAGATAAFADYAGAHASGVDGIHAETEREVSSVIGTDVYRHAATIYQAGSGESGSEALARRSAGCRASSFIPPATNAGQSKGNLFHLAGANGGGTDARRQRGRDVADLGSDPRSVHEGKSQGVVLDLGCSLGCESRFPHGGLRSNRLQDHLMGGRRGHGQHSNHLARRAPQSPRWRGERCMRKRWS